MPRRRRRSWWSSTAVTAARSRTAGCRTTCGARAASCLTSSRRGQLSNDTPDPSGASAFTRHLAEALTLGSLDANGDGYVSLNEVYDYVLDRLREETKQIPQRHFDNTIGDVPLARAAVSPPTPPPTTGGDERPRLEVSETELTIPAVQPDEQLPPEIVDVFNTGGGRLDWTVESTADWITVEQDQGFFRMRFAPKPGINRGTVIVRDRGRGGSKRVRVLVEVLPEQQPPRLTLSPAEVDFGVLSRGEPSPRRTIQITNTGGGELAPRATTTEPWIELHQFGDAVGVLVDTARPGDYTGDVVVRSAGGEDRVRVRARVEVGPVLSVQPRVIDFGRVPAGAAREVRVRVANAGTGDLTWNGGQTADFFHVTRLPDGFAARLTAVVVMGAIGIGFFALMFFIGLVVCAVEVC